jgi:phosphatidylglycerophosphate synthase
MFDAQLRRRIDPVLDAIASAIARAGISANAATMAGACVGIAAGALIAQGWMMLALGLILLNRLIDGLDGALARINGPSAWGGYLDSLADYVFYLAVPVGFACHAAANVWPALLLVSSFTLTAVSFIALAAILAHREIAEAGHGKKAFTYSTGIMEGGETIGFFVAMCLWPAFFPLLALIFAALCIVTVVHRLSVARILLR